MSFFAIVVVVEIQFSALCRARNVFYQTRRFRVNKGTSRQDSRKSIARHAKTVYGYVVKPALLHWALPD